MRHYWMLAGVGLLAVGLAVGIALAAAGPGGGGPPAGGQGAPGVGQGPGGHGPGGPMIGRRLEEAMGKPLTEDQKKQLLEARKTLHEAIKAAHEAHIAKVAAITGLTVDQIRGMFPPPPPPPEEGQGPQGGHRGPHGSGQPPAGALAPSGT